MKKLLSIITIILAVGVSAKAQTVFDDIQTAESNLVNAITLPQYDASIAEWAAIADNPAATTSEKMIAALGEDRAHNARYQRYNAPISKGDTPDTWAARRVNLQELLDVHIPAQSFNSELEGHYIRRVNTAYGHTHLKGDKENRNNAASIPYFAAAVNTTRPRLDAAQIQTASWQVAHMLLGRAQWEEGLIQPGMSNIVESISSFIPSAQLAQKVYDLVRPNRITLQEYKDFLDRLLIALPADDPAYADLLSAIKAKEEALQ